jgi:hypothetical protein
MVSQEVRSAAMPCSSFSFFLPIFFSFFPSFFSSHTARPACLVSQELLKAAMAIAYSGGTRDFAAVQVSIRQRTSAHVYYVYRLLGGTREKKKAPANACSKVRYWRSSCRTHTTCRLLFMCPHTAICVLILLHVSAYQFMLAAGVPAAHCCAL